MALAHIHYNTLDKNEQWQLSAFMHFLGREAVLCNLAEKTTACTSAHVQPRRGVKQHQKKIAVLFGGPVYLEYLLLSSKNINLAYHCTISTLLVFIRIPINSFCY